LPGVPAELPLEELNEHFGDAGTDDDRYDQGKHFDQAFTHFGQITSLVGKFEVTSRAPVSLCSVFVTDPQE
jgi:hypothetical protein